MSTMLEVSGLTHQYGRGERAHVAVRDLTFTIEAGQLACIVGPSGCGKSTLLRCISGLIPATGGSVRLHGDEVSGVPDDLAVVFQDYSRSLFPWLTVAKNVEFPLRWQQVSKADRRRRAAEVLESVGLAGVGKKYPWQLSGGMQQRVSIARALVSRPALLLMDEPFASVDAQTRGELEDLTRRVQRDLGSTILLVTHDIDESVYLADRVLVLSKSPAAIVADLTIDLPAERDQITTRESEQFVSLRGEVARLLQSPQVQRTGETAPETPATAGSDAAHGAASADAADSATTDSAKAAAAEAVESPDETAASRS
ncbi:MULTISPECIES: ABC transporter ATP-binding protein [Prauserella salsuginis group]|uniref:ABC transporter ATP-binding protein n=1 Tax=Prauserella salsuginis TaxID=387889 RepID=A0ABW6G7A9_9PSEU|nr:MULTISPECIES: ABC transporter ATP-binding protein [Prauserella salsuginis group]MCR3720739.1 NitT/TauT family transport system ATP-binding protein [Prauserella flava]MCR3735180.1 NitT/TauT family transport system ATP-binding protein [Prauserella salsuginis]